MVKEMHHIEMTRTGEDFDAWFNLSNGDPWGYNSKAIKNRLYNSLKFIETHLTKNTSMNIVEFGAFNGDFTFLTANNFKNSLIYSIEISEVALRQARNKNKQFNNIQFFLQDMASFKASQVKLPVDVIFMLECLYYLKKDERQQFITNVREEFPNAKVFVSVPIIGGDYFTEDSLMNLFHNVNYECVDFRVLNFKKGYLRPLENLLPGLCKRLSFFRIYLANQVIYFFQPIVE